MQQDLYLVIVVKQTRFGVNWADVVAGGWGMWWLLNKEDRRTISHLPCSFYVSVAFVFSGNGW